MHVIHVFFSPESSLSNTRLQTNHAADSTQRTSRHTLQDSHWTLQAKHQLKS